MQGTFLNCRKSVDLVSARALNNQARYNDVDFRILKASGRFYARDVKVVQTYLTSQTLMSSGIKMGRIKVDDLIEKKQVFLRKRLGSILERN